MALSTTWIVGVTLLAMGEAPKVPAPEVPDLSFMQGSWCGGSDGATEEEVWLAPRGALLLGMHRDVRPGRPTSFEFLRIELAPGRTAYVAQPQGRPPVRFLLASHGPRFVLFANPAHDFPKRIRYERVDEDRLTASVDAGADGKKEQRFTWRRCPVEPAVAR
ncbi:MAG: DUF6265 family protein [Anaeromyxobacteraceae bacterium]